MSHHASVQCITQKKSTELSCRNARGSHAIFGHHHMVSIHSCIVLVTVGCGVNHVISGKAWQAPQVQLAVTTWLTAEAFLCVVRDHSYGKPFTRTAFEQSGLMIRTNHSSAPCRAWLSCVGGKGDPGMLSLYDWTFRTPADVAHCFGPGFTWMVQLG